jgi:HEAT repeat protein
MAVIPPLIEVLEDEDYGIRRVALLQLGSLATYGEGQLPTI